MHIYKKYQGKLIVNTNHKYYVQIQQQLYCTGTLCHFIISNGVWMHIDVILFDQGFWAGVLVKLEFFFTYIFPEIVYPRVLTGAMRWGKAYLFPR